MPEARTRVILLGLAAAMLITAIVAAGIGPYRIAPTEVARMIVGRLSGAVDDGEAATVLFSVRLPRILGAALTGAALSAAGAAYQNLFRNPLVSPDILGVSAGAGLGAVLAILAGLPVVLVELSGFLGGTLAVVLVALVARSLRAHGDVLVLVLAGIVVGSLASAAVSLVKIVADPYQQLPIITYWLLGSLAGIRAEDVAVVAPTVLVGLVPLFLLRWRIGVLSLGEDDARALGVDVRKTRVVVIASATLITAAVVAVSGVVGWIGLMVPHTARLLVGNRFDRLLPASILLGAVFTVVVDTVARIAARIEIPIGILTALIGGGLFVWLLTHRRGDGAWRRP